MTDSNLQPVLPREGRLAGIDYGTVRVGVAVTDRRQTLASPLVNYTRRDPTADGEFFRRLVKDEAIAGLVVGLPVHLSGEESQKSHEARQFGAWLAALVNLPVVFADERFTSTEAEQWLGAAKLTSKERKARRDMLAAQIMLSAFLESRESAMRPPRSLDG